MYLKFLSRSSISIFSLFIFFFLISRCYYKLSRPKHLIIFESFSLFSYRTWRVYVQQHIPISNITSQMVRSWSRFLFSFRIVLTSLMRLAASAFGWSSNRLRYLWLCLLISSLISRTLSDFMMKYFVCYVPGSINDYAEDFWLKSL